MVWLFKDNGEKTKDKRLIAKNSSFFIVLIFYAAHRAPIHSAAGKHCGIEAVEVQGT